MLKFQSIWYNPLRYVGVIWFVFHVIQLLLIRFIQQSLRYMGVIWFVFHVIQLLPVRFTQTKLMLH